MKKILYIDDDAGNRELVSSILTAGGYNYLEAVNGLEGIEKAIACRPNLILMDINMPGLDGFETTTRLKGMDEFKDVPIIGLTAMVSEDDRKRASVAGLDGYMTKPIDVGSFVETIEKYIKGKKDSFDRRKEKGLLKDYTRYLVKNLEEKVRELEEVNRDLEERVDERARALERAQKRLVKLEKKKALLELAGSAAHELNQPLTVIMSLAEVLMDNIDKDNENHELAAKIMGECNRAADIVKKIGGISDYRTKQYYKKTKILDLDKSSS